MEAWEKYKIQVNDWDRLMSIKFIENSKPGGVFCDVGACNGVVTSFFKQLAGPDGKVFAFELNPFNFESIRHLQTENCIIENLAVSENSGTVEIYGDHQNSGNHISNILGHDSSYRKMNSIGKIKSVSLDEYFKDRVVDYLKIDVEGAELQVIKGGLNTIKNCKFVVIECHFEKDWQEIHDILKSNDMDFRNLVDDVPIYIGETEERPGISKNGAVYQIYFKNNL